MTFLARIQSLPDSMREVTKRCASHGGAQVAQRFSVLNRTATSHVWGICGKEACNIGRGGCLAGEL